MGAAIPEMEAQRDGDGQRTARVPSAGEPVTTPIGTRPNWATMNGTQRGSFIRALQTVKNSGRYDEITRLHQQAMLQNSSNWHRRPILLPVHRWMLAQLEAALGQPVPYWDWVVNRQVPAGLGGNGTASQGYRVTTGPFANWTSVIFNSSTGTFGTRPGIIRQIGQFATSLPTATHVQRALQDPVYDMNPWNRNATGGLRNRLESGVGFPQPGMHDRVHEWIGGDMRTGTSPNDPLFYLHHANVDRIWAGWQQRWGSDRYTAPPSQGPDVAMPLTGGVTPRMMFPPPPYAQLP
jgi:tyrosinase